MCVGFEDSLIEFPIQVQSFAPRLVRTGLLHAPKRSVVSVRLGLAYRPNVAIGRAQTVTAGAIDHGPHMPSDGRRNRSTQYSQSCTTSV